MAFWDKEVDLGTIDKNKSEKVKLTVGKKDGKVFLDVRLCKLKAEEGQVAEFKPSSYGAALPVKDMGSWDDIKSKITAALEAMLEEPKEEV
jgi:hypothetical protein